jgi:hypothetical protein
VLGQTGFVPQEQVKQTNNQTTSEEPDEV